MNDVEGGFKFHGVGLELRSEENVRCENWKRHTKITK